MSASELGQLCQQLSQQVDKTIRDGQAVDLPAEDLRALVSATVRLYGTANEGADEATPPLQENVATTEAVVLATALLKAQELNPFDLALWFSRSRTAG